MSAVWDGLRQGLGTLLGFFYDLVPSYGLAIIFLTIVINFVLFPLTLKQTRATRAFQSLQPEIKRLQKEYKDQPEELQKRLMAAQKEAGATPGGCLLPLIVQMPIWFALFNVLRMPLDFIPEGSTLHATIATEHPSFLAMVLDTSPSEALGLGVMTALPYLVLLALMIATQYVQQWHAMYGQDRTAAGAGAQQALTKIMPLFIGVISFNFPAGLVLYWATSNLFRLGQQAVIFKIDGRPANVGAGPEPSAGPEIESDKPASAPQPGAANKRRRRRRR